MFAPCHLRRCGGHASLCPPWRGCASRRDHDLAEYFAILDHAQPFGGLFSGSSLSITGFILS